MGEEKYYTPRLKDIFHGLEVRIKKLDEYHNEHWIPANHDVSKHHIEVGRLATDNSKLKNIKVKYLDQSDIESLGWNLGHKSFHHLEQRKWYGDRIITGGNGKPEGEPTHFLSYIPESCNLQITVVSVADQEMRGDFPEDEKLNGKYCYNGKCYNKSELRWIMDRLGINTEKDQT